MRADRTAMSSASESISARLRRGLVVHMGFTITTVFLSPFRPTMQLADKPRRAGSVAHDDARERTKRFRKWKWSRKCNGVDFRRTRSCQGGQRKKFDVVVTNFY